jgi:RNA polymerase sigma-70 factor (ECF subfamily)
MQPERGDAPGHERDGRKPGDRTAAYPMTGADPGSGSDATLVRAVAAGSHDALAALYDRHGDAVFASASRLTSDRGMAEEVVQETFLALWDRAETFDPSVGSLAAWLHTIARNRTVDRLRAAGRRPNLVALSSAASGSTALGGSDEADADTLERVLASGMLVAGAVPPPSPERELALRELRTALQAALAAMPEPERVVIVMAYAGDLSQSEIADRLGWPLGTVKTRTRRALRHLREVLGSGVGPEYTRYMAPAELAGPDR